MKKSKLIQRRYVARVAAICPLLTAVWPTSCPKRLVGKMAQNPQRRLDNQHKCLNTNYSIWPKKSCIKQPSCTTRKWWRNATKRRVSSSSNMAACNHTIDKHVLTAENGWLSPLPILSQEDFAPKDTLFLVPSLHNLHRLVRHCISWHKEKKSRKPNTHPRP